MDPADIGRVLPFGSTTNFANWGVLDTSPFSRAMLMDPLRHNASQCRIPLLAMQVSSNGDVCPFALATTSSMSGGTQLGQHPRRHPSANVQHGESRTSLQLRRMPDFCRGCSFHLRLNDSTQVEKVSRDPSIDRWVTGHAGLQERHDAHLDGALPVRQAPGDLRLRLQALIDRKQVQMLASCPSRPRAAPESGRRTSRSPWVSRRSRRATGCSSAPPRT